MAHTDGFSDHVEFQVPPTLVFATALILAAACEWFWPTSAGVTPARLLVGGTLVFASFVLMGLALRTFWARAVDPNPRVAVARLVDCGVYGVSRNPIYVSWLGIVGGLALGFDSLWMLAVLPLLWTFLERAVVAREERYLELRLPESYRSYRERVPRWI
jgi:protein-S-isoprenylcysteine O-methyltransferase Ste14